VNATDVYWLPRVRVRVQPGCVKTGFADLSGGQGLVQGVGHQRGVLGGGDPPAQDPSREHVDDERDVHEPGQGPHVGEVGHPQPVRRGRGVPAALDQVRVPRRPDLAHGGAGGVPAADDTGDPGEAHQPADLVPADIQARPPSRVPRLADPVHAPVLLVQGHQRVGQVGLLQDRRGHRGRLWGA
jgi:hypothetical protein